MTGPVDGQIVMDGLLVVGTEPGCGKTVVTTGLVAAMKEKGFLVQAIKPLYLGSQLDSSVFVTEQEYMDQITRPLNTVDYLALQSPYEMTIQLWQQLQHFCRKLGVPCIIESQGEVTTALGWMTQTRYDSTHLARALDVSILITCPKRPGFLNQLIPTITYLQNQGVPVLGWITTETQPIPPSQLPQWESEVLWLQQEYQIPILGELAFSPSIDVQSGHQGNLIKQTQDGIDLFPIEQALNLTLPMPNEGRPRLTSHHRGF